MIYGAAVPTITLLLGFVNGDTSAWILPIQELRAAPS
jgi:hypothetical protein